MINWAFFHHVDKDERMERKKDEKMAVEQTHLKNKLIIRFGNELEKIFKVSEKRKLRKEMR